MCFKVDHVDRTARDDAYFPEILPVDTKQAVK